MKHWPNICTDTWMGTMNWNMEKQFSLLIPFTSVCGMLSAKNCTQINPNLINFMFRRNVFEILSTTSFYCVHLLFIVSLKIFSLRLEFKFEKIQVKLKYLYHTSKHWADSSSAGLGCKTFQQQSCFCLRGEDQEITLFTWLCGMSLQVICFCKSLSLRR